MSMLTLVLPTLLYTHIHYKRKEETSYGSVEAYIVHIYEAVMWSIIASDQSKVRELILRL